MSIERPTLHTVKQFKKMQQLKKQTGNWYPQIGYILGISTVFGGFFHLLYRSMSPTGIVPRILYDKSLPLFKRYTRHYIPWVFLVGSIFFYDVSNGVWSSHKN